METDARSDTESRYRELNERWPDEDVKLGEPLRLPDPWDLTLDTGRLT